MAQIVGYRTRPTHLVEGFKFNRGSFITVKDDSLKECITMPIEGFIGDASPMLSQGEYLKSNCSPFGAPYSMYWQGECYILREEPSYFCDLKFSLTENNIDNLNKLCNLKQFDCEATDEDGETVCLFKNCVVDCEKLKVEKFKRLVKKIKSPSLPSIPNNNYPNDYVVISENGKNIK